MSSSSADTQTVESSLGRRQRINNALELGPRKKSSNKNIFVHHGRHFGRTVHALCKIYAIISNGVLKEGEGATVETIEDAEERLEFQVYLDLIKTVPGILDKITSGDEAGIFRCADMIQEGVSSARADDTKSLKGTILDWIIPPNCAPNPPLSRNQKENRGFNHDITGRLLCPAGMDWNDPKVQEELRCKDEEISGDNWPIFVYENYMYDPENAWTGLLRSSLLVKAFKHIFTSPSSVDKEPKATRAGNAQIHGMKSVTKGSIAYVATQIRFALSSATVFTRSNQSTDSKLFYNSILELLTDKEEIQETNALMDWWNRQIFGASSLRTRRSLPNNSPLVQIRKRRAALLAAQADQQYEDDL